MGRAHARLAGDPAWCCGAVAQINFYALGLLGLEVVTDGDNVH